jgi:hypothetical protein
MRDTRGSSRTLLWCLNGTTADAAPELDHRFKGNLYGTVADGGTGVIGGHAISPGGTVFEVTP